MKSTAPDGRRIRYTPIRRRLRLRLFVRWFWLIVVAVAFAYLYYIALPFCDRTERALMLAMTIALYLVILWKSRVIPRTFAREWVGTVVGREAKKSMKVTGVVARNRNIQWTMICTWTVRRVSSGNLFGGEAKFPDKTGRSSKSAAVTPEVELEKLTYDTEQIWERYFEIGEQVRHYKNARFLVKAHPHAEDENLMCPLCGQLVMQPRCPRCRVDFTEKTPPEPDPFTDY